MTPDPVTRTQVLEALRTVIEPETGCSIIELGLVLSVEVVDHGLTAVVRVAQEPLARRLLDPIRQALESIPGLMDGRLEFSKTPAWDPESMASEAANARLAELAARPSEPATEVAIWDGLAQVIEPELGLPVTELGMIYGVDLAPDGRTANIRLTLTSPMCTSTRSSRPRGSTTYTSPRMPSPEAAGATVTSSGRMPRVTAPRPAALAPRSGDTMASRPSRRAW